MDITYIHHSCFSVDIENVVLLFDYYKGIVPDFDKDKHIFVFASHKHQDHFDFSIFDLANTYPKITFILSKDIRMNEAYMERKQVPEAARENIRYMGADETVVLPIYKEVVPFSSLIVNESSSNLNSGKVLKIETLNSTDEGVAFIVSLYDKVIYHAGDLNWWTWEDDTDEEYKDMTARFQKEMDKIKGRGFSVAFLPLDPRQGNRFSWGVDAFMKTTLTEKVFPMHFWLDYTVIEKLKHLEEAAVYSDKIVDITEEGQRFKL